MTPNYNTTISMSFNSKTPIYDALRLHLTNNVCISYNDYDLLEKELIAAKIIHALDYEFSPFMEMTSLLNKLFRGGYIIRDNNVPVGSIIFYKSARRRVTDIKYHIKFLSTNQE